MTDLNLAEIGGLRARLGLKQGGIGRGHSCHEEENNNRSGRWRRSLFWFLYMASPHLSWGFALRIVLSLFLLAAIATVFISLPVEKMSKAFLSWMVDLGPFGPVILSIANVPLAVLVVPTSVLTLGGGYLFELLVGLLADSTGATIGATVAFILERTIGRSFFLSRLKNYRKFQVVAVAIERSGFKESSLLDYFSIP